MAQKKTETQKQALDAKELYDDLENSQKTYRYLLNVLIEKNEVKAAILLFLLKNRVIYPNFIAQKLFSMNPNTARGFLDRMESAAVVERIPKGNLHEFKEVENFEMLLVKYTQLSGGKLSRIRYYTLTDFANEKVSELSNEFESIISKDVREKMDILKAIIPAEKWEEEKELRKRVEEFNAKQQEKNKKREVQEEKAMKTLLKLCSPFKEEILKLNEEVVMDEPSGDQHFTDELLVIVKKLQEKDKLITPFGVRQVWQFWKRDMKGEY